MLTLIVVLEDESKRYFLEPIYDLQSLELNLIREDKSFRAVAFNAFSLRAKESLIKQIFFVSRDGTEPFILHEGKYKSELYAVTSKDKDWCKYATDSFDISKQDLVVIDPKLPQGFEGKATLTFQNKVFSEVDNQYQQFIERHQQK